MRVTHAVSPYFRAHAGLSDKGVVVGHLAVRIDPYDLALQLVEVLGGGPVVVFPQGNEQIAVPVEHQPRTKMVADRELGLLTENHPEILQRRQVFGQPSAADRSTCLATLAATFGIGQINHPVLPEVRGQRHIQQAALPLGPDLGHAVERRRQFALGRYHTQVARHVR